MFSRQEPTDRHHAGGPLRRAAGLARRALVAIKQRRLWGELICQPNVTIDAHTRPVADAARWPQRPLILGDKWDF
jgi:hypothetical protein